MKPTDESQVQCQVCGGPVRDLHFSVDTGTHDVPVSIPEEAAMAGAPGWYPDSNDARSEIYWDGAKWQGRRQKSPPPIMFSNWPTPTSSGVLGGFRRFWRVQTKAVQRIIITGAVLILISMAFGLAAFVDARPWESQRHKYCRAAGENEGYTGKELELYVDFCVEVGDQ
jgi:hypothetical protein